MKEDLRTPQTLSDISHTLELLRQEIKGDRDNLIEIVTPMGLMRTRAEAAEEAVKVRDVALEALKILQSNNMESIRSSNIINEVLKAKIKEEGEHSAVNQRALDELHKIIERNHVNLKASALALSAVNELAFNDPLTGLPNRRLLADRLNQIIINNKRTDSYSAAIFIDLDKFKILNDEYGHEVGDNLLIAVGSRLMSVVRESDTVARYGGDEFVILLNRLDGNLYDARKEAEKIAQKILSSLLPPYCLQVRSRDGEMKKIEYQNFASLGVAMFDGDISEEKNILDWADEAMYWAKSEGGKTIRFYESDRTSEQALFKLYELATQNDTKIKNHGIRTRQYVKALAIRAMQMGLYPDQLSNKVVDRLFKSTQLYDIGKVKIPYAILHKIGRLTPIEWELIKTHTTLCEEILGDVKKKNPALSDFLNTAIEIAGAHHEFWDGSGYPRGLAGTAIPLAGRIIAIADVYDALISKRSYKEPWTHEEACKEIISRGGKQFDPSLIEAFVQEQDNFRLIARSTRD